MVNVVTLANNLNKSYDYIKELCHKCEIPIHCDKEGEFISDKDAQLFMNKEVKEPTRYNKRGVECIDVIGELCEDNNIQYYYIGCITKYLYRRLSKGDVEKIKTYAELWIKDIEKNGMVE